MVKISIKKDKKAKTKAKPKPKQKQKQKQSQKVIVNIGSSAGKARRGSTLEKNKVVNRSTPTPNIIVPQAMPQNSNIEILKYIRESEQQKAMIKKQEKNNELERDKIKEKKPPAIPTEDENAQTQFSSINSQNISSLTSGTSTPNPLSISGSVDSRSLFTALSRIADINGENPNSGRVSLTFDQPNPLLPAPRSQNSVISSVDYVLPITKKMNSGPFNPRSLHDSLFKLASFNESLVQPERVDIEPSEELTTEAPIPVITDPEPQLEAMPIDPPEGEYLEPEDEEPPEAEEVIDNFTEDELQSYRDQTSEFRKEESAPLVIEPTPPEAVILPMQPEAQLLYENEDQTTNPKTGMEQANEAIDMVNKLLNPSGSKQAEEPSRMVELKSPDLTTDAGPDKPPDVSLYEDKIKGFTALKLGTILIDNNIDNIEGFPFFIDGGHIKSSLKNPLTGNQKNTQINKGELKRYLIDAHNAGLIKI